MKKQTCILIFIVKLLTFVIASIASASSPWNFDIDLRYEKTDKTKVNQPKETIHEVQQQYQIRHLGRLSSETKTESELKAKFERENREGYSTPSEARTVSLYEPYGKFQIKSRLYELQLGYKESEEKTNTILNTKNGFVDLKLQPEYLPEFNLKYDLKGEAKPDAPERYLHNFSVNSLYNVKNFLKIRLDYQGEITDYQNSSNLSSQEQDIKEGNLLGQITVKHFFFSNKLRLDFDYKFEREKEKEASDPNSNPANWMWVNDQLVQTTTTKFSYMLTRDTIMTLHYENKDTDDKKNVNNDDEKVDTLWMDINQKLGSSFKILGKYKYEKSQDIDQVEKTDTYEAEIRADPKEWLDLRGKVKIESKNMSSLTDDSPDIKRDNQTFEGNWKADFPRFFDAQNIFNVKFVTEEGDDIDSTQEEHYKWKLQLTPIVNLKLTPEYNISEEEKEGTTTYEFKTAVGYGLQFSSRLKIDLSHSLSRKRVKGKQDSLDKENNDDSKLDMRFTPTPNLTFSSQILRQSKESYDNGILMRDEIVTSYALNYDWRFSPFTWSTSFKYDDRNYKPEDELGGSDTETFESKLAYRIKNYDLTTNYKYTKTYSLDKDKEQRIGLQLQAHF